MEESNAFPSDEVLLNGVACHGMLEDKIIISVPEDMTHSSVDQLVNKLRKTFKHECIITTHNIKFLKAVEV